MNLYSNKQKWKISLLTFTLILVGASLFFSNSIVSKVAEREKEKATQWASVIRKRIELVQLTDRIFTELREKEHEKMEVWIKAITELSSFDNVNPNNDFAKELSHNNKDIPVIVINELHELSSHDNIDFDTSDIRAIHPEVTSDTIIKLFEDSLMSLALGWGTVNPPFRVTIYEDMFNEYFYSDSKVIVRLEHDRDSMIQAFNKDLVHNKGLVPVLLVSDDNQNILGTNIDDFEISELDAHIASLKSQNTPIPIKLQDGNDNLLYFGNSPELKQLQYFPYIQFIVIGLFALIGYLIFSTFRKAEQNQVWAGMAKETAHQLGTPLSSLMAWVQLLESQNVDELAIREMKKDIDRLEKVSNRFSKIGSSVQMDSESISITVEEVISYLRPRISDKVEFEVNLNSEIIASHNKSLIGWVVENISKNAVDAMEAVGKLTISTSESAGWVHIDIKDTGKGISQKQYKTIFSPGFSTKKRGWGLGLSLVKRIITEYHKGKVFVLESQVDVGTTFRISLPSK